MPLHPTPARAGLAIGLLLALLFISPCLAAPLEWIEVAADGKSFIQKPSGAKFSPWGFNYDHDEKGRLIEDYWLAEWPKVEADFREMKQLGANVVRVHLQVGKFMISSARADDGVLRQLRRLVRLAEDTGLYLDVTGLGCYHRADVPKWYDAVSEAERWEIQSRFWHAVARECRESPAIFCYDLMNEPVAPAGSGRGKDWLGPAFAGKHFVQYISLDAQGRERETIAREWIRKLTQTIRAVDKRHLVTVGLVDWSLKRPRTLYSGFAPEQIAPELDFLCIHLYPESGKVAEAMDKLKGFAVGKPVVIEETFPLKCSVEDFNLFLDQSRATAAGVIGFYWGAPPEELRKTNSIANSLMLRWLEIFQQRAPGKPPLKP
ncbi:MAG: cellulase family glycosylhydrolase [Verrucomicrobia bacterium]|nr:cellulase family glycosylhydrolase [Verrucomicrobiota bacterium]